MKNYFSEWKKRLKSWTLLVQYLLTVGSIDGLLSCWVVLERQALYAHVATSVVLNNYNVDLLYSSRWYAPKTPQLFLEVQLLLSSSCCAELVVQDLLWFLAARNKRLSRHINESKEMTQSVLGTAKQELSYSNLVSKWSSQITPSIHPIENQVARREPVLIAKSHNPYPRKINKQKTVDWNQRSPPSTVAHATKRTHI